MRSPLYARLCEELAREPLVDELEPSPRWDLPLRLLGGLHYLVLSGEAAWDDVRGALVAKRDFLRRFVSEQSVQTNEVQRCYGLLPGFLLLGDGRPVDLIELGPSAGLNLCWDRYRYRYEAGSWGPEGSALELTGGERPGPPASLLTVQPRVRRRLGIDLNPVDVTSEDAARLLECFVWADQTERLERLRRAVAVLREDPPELVQGDYVDVLPQVLAGRDPDALTVVFQIASTPYVAEEGRRRLYTELAQAGRDGSLAFLNATRPDADWHGEGYGLELQTWPGERRHVGHLDFHGEWLAWRG
jgi:hypothetical protein